MSEETIRAKRREMEKLRQEHAKLYEELAKVQKNKADKLSKLSIQQENDKSQFESDQKRKYIALERQLESEDQRVNQRMELSATKISDLEREIDNLEKELKRG